MSASEAKEPPILQHKRYGAPSAFTPENLLRQARRQKRLPDIAVPDICILDPDGDIVRNLCAAERARRHGAGPATTPSCTSFVATGTNTALWVAQSELHLLS
jgi:hypothetical protein